MDTTTRGRRAGRPVVGLATALVAALAAALALAAPAGAALTIGTFEASAHDDAGNEVSQAGAHPDFTTTFMFDTETNATGGIVPSGSVKDVKVELPPGVIGNPTVLPTCTVHDLEGHDCPPESQVGEATLYIKPFPTPSPPIPFAADVYNLVPPAGKPAQFGFAALNVMVVMQAEVRTGDDYGLTITVPSISQALQVFGTSLTFWGVPGRHTPADERAFMSNPTVCGAPVTTTLRVNSWQHPNQWDTATATSSTGVTGCDQLPFAPGIQTVTGSRVVDDTAKLTVGVTIPQSDDPARLASAHLKKATVQLPEGVSINPGLGHDLTACSDGAFALHGAGPSSCPPGSKIGTAGIDTPLLDEPIPGDIYVGEPQAGNPFRLFVYAAGSGVRIKLEGSVRPDPKTGRLTATFDDNPQLPFSAMRLELQGGPQAVLAMPSTCGTKRTTAVYEPWSGQPAVAASDFFLTLFADPEQHPCPGEQPFVPQFEAGVTSSGAGEDSAFVVRFRRPDGHQSLGSLRLDLPTGLLGRLAAFPLCPNADANADRCSDDSKVGGVVVSAGPGASPLNVAGEIFLTEPPKPGQVAGLAIVVPAVAGPYHLGTPIVRAGITVNPDTSLTVESDPLPTILQGVPLRIQQVIVKLDRAGFMFNPTDCSPKKITGEIVSTTGARAGVASPFSVRGCDELPFAPEMTIESSRPDAESRTDFHVGLKVPDGNADMRQVSLTLPSRFGARLDGPLQTPCSETDFAEDACQASAKVATSRAVTPVLPTPLAGDVFFVENPEGGLPRLGIRLKGLVTIDVIGHVEIVGGRVNATFPAIPDVPISEFRLDFESGDRAVLTASGICGAETTAALEVIAHSGRVSRQSVDVAVAGCNDRAARRAARKAHHKAAAAKRAATKTGRAAA